MSIFDKAACWNCHDIFLNDELEPSWEGCNIRILCPRCLPHSKEEKLTCPDRPAPPVVNIEEDDAE